MVHRVGDSQLLRDSQQPYSDTDFQSGAITDLLGEGPVTATKSVPEKQLIARDIWSVFVKASSTNVSKCNSIVFRGKCKVVKHSRTYGSSRVGNS